MTDVVILCGGRGTRLQPATETRPKPLVPVGSRPILDHIIRHFVQHGFRRFMLCLGYRGAAILDHFRAWADGGAVVRSGMSETVTIKECGVTVTVVLLDTGLDTCTGGRIKLASPHILSDRFVVAYADVLSDVDLTQLCAFHVGHGRLATVTAVRPRSPFGHLVLGDDDRVRGFQEKPRLNEWVNIGITVLERAVLQQLTANSPQLEVGLFPQTAATGQMAVYRHRGCFEPMNSYADYIRLNELYASGSLDWVGGTAAISPRACCLRRLSY